MNISYQHNGVYCYNLEESIEWYTQVLEFKLLYQTEQMEGDKPLKMAWIKNNGGVVIELLEQVDKEPLEAVKKSPNHIALRVDDMDAFVEQLQKNNVEIEAGPFATDMVYGVDLSEEDRSIFSVSSEKGLKLKIMFFRGPGNERFEVVQDNIQGL